jgi:hypothetical protein
MGCCGDHRAITAMSLFDVPVAPVRGGQVRVAYLGRNSFSVRGTYSGQRYWFSPELRVQWVDAADSRVLLRTRYFRRA